MRTVLIVSLSQMTARMAFEAMGFAPGTAKLQLVQPNVHGFDRVRGYAIGTVMFVLQDVLDAGLHITDKRADAYEMLERCERHGFQLCRIDLDKLLRGSGLVTR